MRVIIADDRPETRSGLKLLFEQEPGVRVVGEAADLSSLISEAHSARPDVVLVDWELPCLRVHDVVSLLRMLSPGLRIVALSGRPEVKESALSAGAETFVSKGSPPERVLESLRRLSGEEAVR